MNTLGSRISKLRKDLGITQDKLMKTLNFDNLSKYEKDLREPNLTILKSIANFFDVSTDYLLGLDTVPNRNNLVKEESDSYYSTTLSKDEILFLDKFRKLSDNDKLKIEGMVELKLFENQKLENMITADTDDCDNK